MSVADVHFAIGKTHAVCQDYGVAGSTKPPPAPSIVLKSDPDFSTLTRNYALVSDGCSSSADTDIGARLLCRAAVWDLGMRVRSALIGDDKEAHLLDPGRVIEDAEAWQRAMQLDETALDATLMAVFENVDKNAEVHVYGDGVVVARRRDGTGYDYIEVECSLNAPTYLSYLLSDKRMRALIDNGGGYRTIREYRVGETPTETEDIAWAADLPDGEDAGLAWTFDRATYDVVLVMTDGAQSFQKREGTRFVPVPLEDVLHQVMDFKQVTPGFIRRRLNKFLTKFCPDNGWHHTDDFAVAGIVLDPPEGSGDGAKP